MSAVRARTEPEGAVFDRRHFEHYTMHDQRLAAEVLGLFLAQLPTTLQLLDEAATAADWRFAAHALKGSAAAVGAQKLHRLAVGLESGGQWPDRATRLRQLEALHAAAAEFRTAVQRDYPASAAP